jgi:hypothetical protein
MDGGIVALDEHRHPRFEGPSIGWRSQKIKKREYNRQGKWNSAKPSVSVYS